MQIVCVCVAVDRKWLVEKIIYRLWREHLEKYLRRFFDRVFTRRSSGFVQVDIHVLDHLKRNLKNLKEPGCYLLVSNVRTYDR